ncbi:hypothetical protein I4F81_009590 [Pyropia yezoensis]|uniref:Uncharacterized protein n=1 Tax=Pyropia yezoensis TaxID=2788 RepID=A0ACC3CBD1_PYRYE|nr:hypothetical protein I4F81_009590 [Neopyropia yezoensis]
MSSSSSAPSSVQPAVAVPPTAVTATSGGSRAGPTGPSSSGSGAAAGAAAAPAAAAPPPTATAVAVAVGSSKGKSSSGGGSAGSARAVAGRAGTNRVSNSCILRIQQEITQLIQEPVPFIYVEPDEEDITHIQALIIGPLETPYAGGMFHFDIRVPPEYPFKPPQVNLRTTDGGRVRFNPNLYATGRVCLSILGTWEGPAWSSAESLSSVLLSIQSLMCAKPYHNEPGFENVRDSAAVARYNEYISYETLRVAVVGMIDAPTCGDAFSDVMERHILLWFDMFHHSCIEAAGRLEHSTYADKFSTARGTYKYGEVAEKLLAARERILARLTSVRRPRPMFPTVSLAPGAVAASTTGGGAGSPAASPRTTPPPSSSPAAAQNGGAGGDSAAGNGAATPAAADPFATEVSADAVAYATERLVDEHRALSINPPAGVSASPRDPAFPFVWDATVSGPERSAWEGGLFSLEIYCAADHPARPPFVRFAPGSEMFHPNVTPDGMIPALSCVNARWNPATKLSAVLVALQQLLASPDATYAVNAEAAKLFATDRKAYERRARRIAQG